jgi:hypothetical protein
MSTQDLTESRDRLVERGLFIAISHDGERGVITSRPSEHHWRDGTVWSPQECMDYIEAPPEARRVMREAKAIRPAA